METIRCVTSDVDMKDTPTEGFLFITNSYTMSFSKNCSQAQAIKEQRTVQNPARQKWGAMRPIHSSYISEFPTLLRLVDIDEHYNPIQDYIDVLDEAILIMKPHNSIQRFVQQRVDHLRKDLVAINNELKNRLEARKEARHA